MPEPTPDLRQDGKPRKSRAKGRKAKTPTLALPDPNEFNLEAESKPEHDSGGEETVGNGKVNGKNGKDPRFNGRFELTREHMKVGGKCASTHQKGKRLATRIRLFQLEKQSQALERDCQLKGNIGDMDYLAILAEADKYALDYLADVARGLVPDVTIAQRIDAAKQIRALADERLRGPGDLGDKLKRMGMDDLEEAERRLTTEKSKKPGNAGKQEQGTAPLLE